MGLIRHTAKDKAKAVFFSKLIIITALIPIFSFQKVEGKMFSPLAYTLGFALLGALLFTLTLVPVMSSMLLKKNVREKNNFFVRFINEKASALFDKCYAHRKLSIGLASIAAIVGLWMFTLLGTEFLPQLNEGSIYIRATLPQSISLDESVQLANQMRRKLAAYPEVRQVLSQTGRPNDGTDATGFYNIEFHVDIYPEKDWESKLSKLQLIDKMQDDLSLYPGIDFNFSQPITDNVEEAASGVKGSIAVKVFGKDLYKSEKIAVQIDKILSTVQGIEDLGVIRNIGQPELRIELNEQSLARYGVAKEDVQSIIEMAIGGKSASLLYEDERKFNIMVRYKPEYRQNEEEIGKILVPTMNGTMIPTMNGTMIPIKELAEIKTITGPLLIFRDNHTRFCAVKFSVRGRDMGTAVAEAQKKVNASVHLPEGYTLKWTGDFENQQRATKRLSQVVPVSIAIIFIILFVLFSNARDAGLVLLNVPFAAVGGIIALLITHFNFSISAGIGFIALFGICIQNGVIMISDIKHNIQARLPLPEAIKTSMRSLHPTHSMSGYGKNAAEYLAGEEYNNTPCTPGGCYDRLKEVGGKVLLVGVGHERNTYIHSVEEVLNVPNRLSDMPMELVIELQEESNNSGKLPPYNRDDGWKKHTDNKLYRKVYVRKHYNAKQPHISEDFVKLNQIFLDSGVVRKVKFGDADSLLCDAKGMFNIVRQVIAPDPECIVTKDTLSMPEY